MEISVENIRENLARARGMLAEAAVSAGRSGAGVKVMAVTKTHPTEIVRMAVEAGADMIGENRVSEGGRKIRALGKDFAEFHMIGPLHTKEVRRVVKDFHWIDSVDRMKIAEEIAFRTVDREERPPGILLEVNTSGEDSKFGFSPEITLLEDVIGRIFESGLEVSGFLTVGPLGASEISTRKAFATLRELRDRLSERLGVPLPELSMGMSDDFILAAAEGATTVRLGRFLLGSRKT